VVDTPVGPLGIVISWEVFFADRARDAIGNGGEVLLNPTNGSSYWLTQVQTQQVASSRLRAIETGRWELQAAPTGFSALVDPAGNLLRINQAG
jgi:apolipoprotein N-acyltransferase